MLGQRISPPPVLEKGGKQLKQQGPLRLLPDNSTDVFSRVALSQGGGFIQQCIIKGCTMPGSLFINVFAHSCTDVVLITLVLHCHP